MNRWIAKALAGWVLACAYAAPLLAQVLTQDTTGVARDVPTNAKLAIIGITPTPPVITVNGQPDRLSPGSRIRNRRNMVVLSASLAGQNVYAVYKRDAAGLVHEVWLLSADEYAKLGGINAGDPDGWRRFNELLALIFGARQ
ncbi:MAG TPA: hypothetical protein VHA82_17210 [Ramlibacter sp.]|uniref:hypothetical protein n=1 Tax=Ramlibacter sp. TaxID=1917967 RepID=UPI002C5CF3C5|nr:hypothetical protein [Ramlibacter sp.]HVZ45552.1 hypothetical protein [Ramlibacter sp.]